MKKLAVLILAAVITLSLPCFTVFAAESISVVVSSVSATAGEDVEITVSVQNNPGVCALGFVIPYDSDGLSLISAEYTELFGNVTEKIYNDGKAIYFNIARADNVYANGVIATLKFHINDSFDTKYTLTPSVRAESGFVLRANADYSLEDVELLVSAGTVSVKGNIITPATEPVTEPVTDCAHENTAESVKTEPTCMSEGTKEIKCESCGEILSEESIPKAEHSYGEWTVTKEATTEENGERAKVCSECGETVIEPIEKLTEGIPTEEPKTPKTLIFGIICICIGAVVAISIIYKRFGKHGIEEAADDNNIDDDTDNKFIVS